MTDLRHDWRLVHLANGLRLITVARPGTPTVAVRAYVRAGSRYDLASGRRLWETSELEFDEEDIVVGERRVYIMGMAAGNFIKRFCTIGWALVGLLVAVMLIQSGEPALAEDLQEQVEKGEDKERSCSRCRSNSIRHLKPKRRPAAKKGGGNGRGSGG